MGSTDGEIWPILLEKAWAKLHGTYTRIQKSDVSMTIPHFLGCPSYRLTSADWHEKCEEFFERVKVGCERKFVQTTSTRVMSEEESKQTGLYSKHTYTVVDTF